jgi:hypothetical protein
MIEISQETLTHTQNTMMTTDAAGLGRELSTSLAVEVKALLGSTSSPENTEQALSSDCSQDTNQRVLLSVIQERKRQASLSFNVTLILIATTGIISIVGIALLFLGKVTEGTVTTAGGLAASNIVSVRCLKLNKDTNDRLDQMVKDSQEED